MESNELRTACLRLSGKHPGRRRVVPCNRGSFGSAGEDARRANCGRARVMTAASRENRATAAEETRTAPVASASARRGRELRSARLHRCTRECTNEKLPISRRKSGGLGGGTGRDRVRVADDRREHPARLDGNYPLSEQSLDQSPTAVESVQVRPAIVSAIGCMGQLNVSGLLVFGLDVGIML